MEWLGEPVPRTALDEDIKASLSAAVTICAISVREGDAWEEWVLYMLAAVESTARDAIGTVVAIRDALLDAKHRIRAGQFVERALNVSRLTATKYLDALVDGGFLAKQRIGRSNYYINRALYPILTGEALPSAPATA